MLYFVVVHKSQLQILYSGVTKKVNFDMLNSLDGAWHISAT